MTSRITQIMMKIIIILLIFMIINMPAVKAVNYWDEIIDGGKNFIDNGKQQENLPMDSNQMRKINSKIYSILFSLGIVLSVIIGGVLGIQIMWGSIEQQVKAKEMLMPYAIGCVVIFGAFGIWKLCVTIFSQL